MNSSSIVDIIISNISKEVFNYILLDITTVVNIHSNTDYLPEEIYNYIYFKDGNERNLDVNNMVLLA